MANAEELARSAVDATQILDDIWTQVEALNELISRKLQSGSDEFSFVNSSEDDTSYGPRGENVLFSWMWSYDIKWKPRGQRGPKKDIGRATFVIRMAPEDSEPRQDFTPYLAVAVDAKQFCEIPEKTSDILYSIEYFADYEYDDIEANCGIFPGSMLEKQCQSDTKSLIGYLAFTPLFSITNDNLEEFVLKPIRIVCEKLFNGD